MNFYSIRFITLTPRDFFLKFSVVQHPNALNIPGDNMDGTLLDIFVFLGPRPSRFAKPKCPVVCAWKVIAL